MTDPIAVDVPKPPSFARSVPGSIPLAPLLPLPTPAAPKPIAIALPAAAVPPTPLAAAVPPTPTPTPVPSKITPAPITSAKWLGLFTKKQLTIAASAVFSLVAGIGAVRLMFPTKEEPKPSAAVPQDWAAVPRANAPESPKATTEVPTSADNLPPIPLPTMPPFPTTPVTPPSGARPTGIAPVPLFPLPSAELDPRYTPTPPLVPAPMFELPPIPTPGVTPISGTEPKTPPLPVLPAIPLPGAPVVPAVPSGVEPIIPPPPAAPKLPIPTPSGGPVFPAVPDPKFPPSAVIPDPKIEPVVPNPFPKVDLTPPAFGTPTGFTKPGGTTEPKPVVPETLPRTNFDVDLYEPRANDTYESISQEFYNDKRFAGALRAFNRNQVLTGVRYIEVPPMHVLRRQFAAQVGAAPTGVGAPLWGAAAEPVPAAVRTRTTFLVPVGGMTMKAVARETLGSDLRWNDIYDLNPQYNPSATLPAGTELKMPAGARLP